MKIRLPLLLVAAALPALALRAAADDDKDKAVKTARNDIKRSEKRLEAQDHDPAMIDGAIDAVRRVRDAENEEAVLFLLRYAHEAVEERVVTAIRVELGKVTLDDAIKPLVTVLKAKKADWRERVLAAQVAVTITNPKIVEGVVAGLEDTDLNLVGASIAAAATKEDKKVLETLVKLLGRLEKVGGNEYFSVRQALVTLTGQDFMNAEKWKAWWDANKKDFDFTKKGTEKEAKTQEKTDKGEKPVFFGTEVRSSRLVFVVDVSGSMKMWDSPEGPDNPEIVKKGAEEEPKADFARIERARKELKNAIEKLQPWQRFNIISFSDSCKTWQPDLQPANDSNRKGALEFVAALEENGGTFTDDALRRAFAMNEIDTIYFLSDGAPQRELTAPGKPTEDHQRKLMGTCYEIVKKETRFRKVTIHTFGLCGLGVWYKKWGPRPPSLSLDPASIGPLRDFMKELAKMTGGEFKSL